MNAVASSAGRLESSICQEQIDALVDEHPGIDGALVSTVDGFEISACIRGPISVPKLSAMTSSLLALADAISLESRIGTCRDIVIDAGEGRVLLMHIPCSDRRLLLTVLCDDADTLGQVLWAARICREAIAARLNAA